MNFFIISLFVVLGLCIGSFLNAAIFRLAKKESVARGRSKCLHCGTQLVWYDLIPVLSFLLLRGKCRRCHAFIDVQYILVEVFAAVLFGIAALLWSLSGMPWLQLVRDCFAVSIFLFLFVYDCRYYLLPDMVTLPAVAIIIVLNLVLGMSPLAMCLGALIGGGFFALQFVLSKGRWIGGGDIRLGVLMGVLLSWPLILVALFIAYVSGAAIGIILLLMKKKHFGSKLPFGTFLSVSSIATLWYGQVILQWYLGYLH